MSNRLNSEDSGDRASYKSAMPLGLFRIAAEDLTLFEEIRSLLVCQLKNGEWPTGQVLGEGRWRAAFAADSISSAIQEADSARPAQILAAPTAGHAPITFMFSGLSGDAASRLLEIAKGAPELQDIFDRANSVVSLHLGKTIEDLVTDETVSRSHEQRRLLRRPALKTPSSTPAAHALLFIQQCALAKLWEMLGVRPSFVMGYSLGEYAAAVSAQVYDFEDALSLVIDRARALDTLENSALIAVAGRYEDIAGYLLPDLHLVAKNSDLQTVIGGPTESVEAASNSLKDAGYAVERLQGRHAIHTPLMEKARRKVELLASKLVPRDPAARWISTVTGSPITSSDLRDGSYWGRHLCQQVKLGDALDVLRSEGAEIYVELGPGQALSAIVDAILVGVSPKLVVATMPSEYDTRPPLTHFLNTAGKLWQVGAMPLPNISSLLANKPYVVSPFIHRETTAIDLLSKIQQIWSEILDRPLVQPNDNLFDMGGNSLRCARIAMRLKRELGIELTVRDVLKHPTPNLLCRLVTESQQFIESEADVTLPNGLRVKCQSPAEAEYFYQSIFVERSYLRNNVNIEPRMTIFDVGANIGLFSIFAALEAPDVRLFSFEPVPHTFELLKHNVSSVCDEVTLLNVGISDKNGESRITYYPNSPGMSSFIADRGEEQAVLKAILHNSFAQGNEIAGEILEDTGDYMDSRFDAQEITCALQTLSSVIDQASITTIDLLKIDVQKLELNVLNGINDKHWPLIKQIVIEVHDQDDRVETIRDLLVSRSFNVISEQDDLYVGSNIHMIYGTR